MTTRTFVCRGALMLVAAAGAGAFATAAPAGHSAAGTKLHLTAAFHSVLLRPGPSCKAPLLLVRGTGSATGTYLGSHATTSAEECSDSKTKPGFFLVRGKGIFTTEKGEKLFLNYDERSAAPNFKLAHPTIHDEGTFVVAGGTGRFAGATGSGSIVADGVISFQKHVYSANVKARYDGTIKFAG